MEANERRVASEAAQANPQSRSFAAGTCECVIVACAARVKAALLRRLRSWPPIRDGFVADHAVQEGNEPLGLESARLRHPGSDRRGRARMTCGGNRRARVSARRRGLPARV